MARGNRAGAILLWLVLTAAGPGVAAAEDTTIPFPSNSQADAGRAGDEGDTALNYKPGVGIALLAGAIASAALPNVIGEHPPTCRWCGGASPNVVDRWARNARWEHPCRANKLSTWSLGLAGAIALGPVSHESSYRQWLVNVGAIVDAAAVTEMVTQATKHAIRRERPASNPCLSATDTETDRNLSFFSGHTAIAFAAAAAARETARLRGRSTDGWLWVSGASAAVTGYLRIAANRHHLTDVVAGAGVGLLMGTWVPRHLHGPKPAPVAGIAVASRSVLAGAPPLGVAKSMESGGRRFLVQVAKGPGRSIQFSLTF